MVDVVRMAWEILLPGGYKTQEITGFSPEYVGVKVHHVIRAELSR